MNTNKPTVGGKVGTGNEPRPTQTHWKVPIVRKVALLRRRQLCQQIMVEHSGIETE